MSSENAESGLPTATAEATSSSNVKLHACVLCQQRKVRCDRLPAGCSNCTKARVECIYRAPLPPRRRKRRIPETDLLVRLKHYEDLLKNLGVELESENVQGGPASVAPTSNVDNVAARLTAVKLRENVMAPKEEVTGVVPAGMEYGKLIGKGANTRYLENRLWTTVTAEMQDPTDVLTDDLSEDEYLSELDQYGAGGIHYDPADLILRSGRSSISLRGLHPSAVHMFKLWQLFMDNVNPMMKIIHNPSTQQLILEASGDLNSVSKPTEALLFAIYSTALGSTTPEECQQIFGESKASLGAKFRFGTQQALTNAGLLKTSDIRVLQAYELYLMSLLPSCDPAVLWTLSGVCVRIAQKMGLHRDGTAFGLSVFEVEMRRRLWWQILILDSRVAELCGSGTYVHLWDSQKPLNVNDSDLTPDMKEPPIEHSGPTEMMFVSMRNEVGEWLRRSAPVSTFDGAWNAITSPNIPVADKLQSIAEIEATLQEKFLQYCDPSVPLHFLTLSIAGSSVARMRFLALISAQKGRSSDAMTQKERDDLLNLCLQQIEHTDRMRASQALQRFSWLLYSHFQWMPFIFMLNELKMRPASAITDRLWKYVEQIFKMKPELMSQPKRSLYVAVDNMTLKAWEAYEARNGARAYGDRGGPPPFIIALREKRDGSSTAPSASSPSTMSAQGFAASFASTAQHGMHHSGGIHDTKSDSMMGVAGPSQTGLSGPGSFASGSTPGQLYDSPMDWDQWNDFIKNFEMESMSGLHMGNPSQF